MHCRRHQKHESPEGYPPCQVIPSAFHNALSSCLARLLAGNPLHTSATNEANAVQDATLTWYSVWSAQALIRITSNQWRCACLARRDPARDGHHFRCYNTTKNILAEAEAPLVLPFLPCIWAGGRSNKAKTSSAWLWMICRLKLGDRFRNVCKERARQMHEGRMLYRVLQGPLLAWVCCAPWCGKNLHPLPPWSQLPSFQK